MEKTIRMIDWMLCDDIRQENNGKRIFIGVYDDSIIVPSVPLTIPQIVFYSKWDITAAPIKKFEFKMVQPGGKIIGPIVNELSPPSPESNGRKAIVQIGLTPFNIEASGEYRIQAKINDIDYDTIASFTVTVQSARSASSNSLN